MARARNVLVAALFAASASEAGAVRVSTASALQQALRAARPGSRILVAPGNYEGYFLASNLRGTPKSPVVIAAADPSQPPVLRGRAACLQLSDVSYVVLRGLVLVGATGNGLNIDDGGSYATPSHHIVLERLAVRDIGPQGNRDGIKLSGVDDFVVRGCTLERWGSDGSAIDLVGCHRGLIADCEFRHERGRGSNAVQAKGGSKDVVVYACRFQDAGLRAIQMGGSTGLAYFRPKAPGYEARRIVAVGNTFVGSMAPVAYVSSEACEASFNTLYRPSKWVFRILQESRGERFVACRTGLFRGNLVVWRRGDVRAFVNVGPHTEPETFRVEGNWWYCEDAPARSRPRLPVAEKGGIVGRDPQLKVHGLTITASGAPGHGAHSEAAAKAFAQIGPKLAPWACQVAAKRTEN